MRSFKTFQQVVREEMGRLVALHLDRMELEEEVDRRRDVFKLDSPRAQLLTRNTPR